MKRQLLFIMLMMLPLAVSAYGIEIDGCISSCYDGVLQRQHGRGSSEIKNERCKVKVGCSVYFLRVPVA